jgi:pimeloyl-ACP methyl ester carboxylesterase
MSRFIVAVALLAAAFYPAAARAQASAEFRPCPEDPAIECGSVVVPLDRSGVVPGQVRLHVKRLTAKPSRGTMLLLAGGPGQSSTRVFDLKSTRYRRMFPGFTLATFDMRGTGDSGALRCAGLETAEANVYSAAAAKAVEACANALGPSRAFYTTQAAAADIESVRQALGSERLGLFGGSYGTKLGLAYATAYPASVERLVLDSVLPLSAPDPFSRSTIASIPTVLNSVCARSLCRRATPSPVSDFVELANRLAERPLHGDVIGADGRPRKRAASAEDLFLLLRDIDRRSDVRALFPGAVRSAVLGDPAPLVRLLGLASRPAPAVPSAFSLALHLSTLCEDGPLPWSRTTPPAERAAEWRAAAARLPRNDYAPFGPWAAALEPGTQLCVGWPHAAGAPVLGSAPLPDVPVLTLAGDLDLRTPAHDALAVAAMFSRGRALIVRGAGHGVTWESSCAIRRVAEWIARDAAPAPCPRLSPLLPPLPRAPRSLAEVPPARGAAGRRGRTLNAVSLTLADAMSTLALLDGRVSPTAVGGLRGGRLLTTEGLFQRYSYVPGVWVSGRLNGMLRVGGPQAAHGTLRVELGLLRGVLEGRRVRERG